LFLSFFSLFNCVNKCNEKKTSDKTKIQIFRFFRALGSEKLVNPRPRTSQLADPFSSSQNSREALPTPSIAFNLSATGPEFRQVFSADAVQGDQIGRNFAHWASVVFGQYF
jgi:hypothetical protein